MWKSNKVLLIILVLIVCAIAGIAIPQCTAQTHAQTGPRSPLDSPSSPRSPLEAGTASVMVENVETEQSIDNDKLSWAVSVFVR